MNTRGNIQLNIVILVIVSIVATILSLAFVVNNTFRFVLVGIVMLFTVLVMGVRNKPKNNREFAFYTIFILIGILLILLPATGILQTQLDLSDSLIQIPVFGTVKCDVAEGSNIQTGSEDFIDNAVVVCPENTKECTVLISMPGSSTFYDRGYFYKICNRDGSNCESEQQVKLPFGDNIVDYNVLNRNLLRDQSIRIDLYERFATFAPNRDTEIRASIKWQYRPYILVVSDVLGGGETPWSGSVDCKVPKSTQLYTDAIIVNTLFGKTTTEYKLQDKLNPDETYNYISGFVSAPNYGTEVTYNNQKGYCATNIQGKQAVIFGISRLETPSAIFSVVDTNKIIVESPTIQCCKENQVILNQVCKNFKLVTITEQQKEDGTIETNVGCSLLRPCNPGRFVLSDADDTSFTYECINGQCVISNIRVEECTSSEDCGLDKICVNFKCQLASTTPELENIPEDDNDTQPNTRELCEQRAKDNPFLGSTWVETTVEPTTLSKVVTVFTFGAIGDLTAKTTGKCVDTYIPYYIIGGIILVFVIVIIILLRPTKSRRKRR